MMTDWIESQLIKIHLGSDHDQSLSGSKLIGLNGYLLPKILWKENFIFLEKLLLTRSSNKNCGDIN